MPRSDIGVCVREGTSGPGEYTAVQLSRSQCDTASSLIWGNRADMGQELNNYETGNLIPAGVYTLDDVKRYGIEKGVCPYFTIRRMVSIPIHTVLGYIS